MNLKRRPIGLGQKQSAGLEPLLTLNDERS